MTLFSTEDTVPVVDERGTFAEDIRRRLEVQTQQSFTVNKLTKKVSTQITLYFTYISQCTHYRPNNTKFPDFFLRFP
jgi:hypothetical protein